MLRQARWMLILVCGLLLPASAHAQEAPPGKWWRLPRVAEALKLTEAEKQTLDDLYLNNRRELIQLKGRMETEQLELEPLLDKDPLDEQAAMAQFVKVQQARSRLAEETFRFILGVRKTIGPERFRQLKEIHKRLRNAGDRSSFRDRSFREPRP